MAASKLAHDAPARFAAIYAKLRALKSPQTEPFLLILRAFHSQPPTDSPPKIKHVWSSGGLNNDSPDPSTPGMSSSSFNHLDSTARVSNI